MTDTSPSTHASAPSVNGTGAKGLKVERIFTTPGVHPYDDVTWERRDVVQTNWKTGETIFEQRGVEFPDFWSANASTIVTTKYFRGAPGTQAREWSLRQLLDRVVLTYTKAGKDHGYFASDEDAEVFEHELTYALLHQVFSFNSPVWFNVGTASKAQVSACFILSVDDTMDSILNWYREEGLIFKGGSGAGINLSRIRSSKELLSSGGTASGPVSFMRGADASAGTIKSGGATRRAAKMVVLDVDHPDVEEFIETKANEERKIRALRDAGFDMDLGGKDITSVQYQNANNSVRVSDEFMRAVEQTGQFGLRSRTTGEVLETVDAKALFKKMAKAAWECADPGIQYDDTINDWHTNPETGRITASNPCFPADQRVVTDKGLVPIGEMVARAVAGETFGVYTHDATNASDPSEHVQATEPVAYMTTGRNPIVKLRFDSGAELRCTPRHRIFTTNRGYVHADELTPDDRVKILNRPAAAWNASYEIPAAAREAGRRKWESVRPLNLPEKWTPEFAHLLGWLVGDGAISGNVVSWVYGSQEDQEHVLPRHRELMTHVNGGTAPAVVTLANGTQQVRLSRGEVKRFLGHLGITDANSHDKRLPPSVLQAPTEILGTALAGLFDADGYVHNDSRGCWVGLGSTSHGLLRDVQEALAALGVVSRIHKASNGRTRAFAYTTVKGESRSYDTKPTWYLAIAGHNIRRFASVVGFTLPRKAEALEQLLRNRPNLRDNTIDVARLLERTDDGFETTYNLTEPRNHSYLVGGLVVANCSEYLSLDDSSCNLASLNLLKFLREDDTFDAKTFAKVVELVITAMDISICFADFPTEKIGETTRAYRQLGIGYANLGALLMATGKGYDSEGGRALAAAITSLMTGTAYKRSAELAGVVDSYEGYARNAVAHRRVMRKHAASNDAVRTLHPLDRDVHALATQTWEECLRIGEKNGWRNAQASVLAPTGCLTGDTLVTTNRGLLRLSEIGAVWGRRWQELDLTVSTDEGPRDAINFFVNGEEPTRRIVTRSGYSLQGTLAHRVKVVEPETGEWVWRRLADVREGDLLPLQLGTLVGEPRRVRLPALGEPVGPSDHAPFVPEALDADLAELAGYVTGGGSASEAGLRLRVSEADDDVVARLRVLIKGLFGLEPHVSSQSGGTELVLASAALGRWWRAAGFGQDQTPRMPHAVRETNDPAIYAAFIRGLFEAVGTVIDGVPGLATASATFADDLRTMLLALGLTSSTRTDGGRVDLRVRHLDHGPDFDEVIGFLGERKARLTVGSGAGSTHAAELIPSPAGLRRELAATGDLLDEGRGVDRDLAVRLYAATGDARLAHALQYVYEPVTENSDGGVQPTYDLSVPENVTYVANGFVSHNTIGFMMDCDTTGVEPDFSLVKFKKLVGGGSMQIVNQTIPRALRQLGYTGETVEAIVEYIAEHGHVVDAPGLRPEHYEVFDCAMGERAIRPMGHVRMMAAVQPFLSGAISKCVVGDTLITTEDGLVRIGSLHKGEEPDSFRQQSVAVASLGGTKKTDAFYYGGVRPVREVTLRSGHRVTGTPNHRLLVATPEGPDWRHLSEVSEGDYVALQYGAEMWSALPARFDDFRASPRYGSQKDVRIPAEMSEDLAFLLGAYASEGHTTRSTWTVVITNSCEEVLQRVQACWQTVFGVQARIVRQKDKCPAVLVASKEIVEFLAHLGCGSRASDKRIPDTVLRSPRKMVLAFLQGLALDAYVHVSSTGNEQAKWAICLDSGRLLDDLQAVLTNLGVLHGRVRKFNPKYGKHYDEVYASGEQARTLSMLVPFAEPEKAANARRLVTMSFGQSTADVVPCITGRQLYEAIPLGAGWGKGLSVRNEFTYLLDPRTQRVSRRTLEKVAAVPGVQLPQWVYDVIWDGLHFTPVVQVRDAGEREVYDLSVPETHAFVGNGVVNHNTVNVPETATVEEIEDVYFQAWKLGLKALAIYRDNCKVGQPLSDGGGKAKKDAAGASAPVVEYRPVRKRLPKSRPSVTTSFAVGGAEGYMTASSYPDDGLGEVFLKMSKQGSTLAGMMDAFSVAVSIGLQYGVPLETFVSKFLNMRFEPAGLTDDQDVRMAQSIMDYIFRRLALDYLPFETRGAYGVYSAEERARQLETGSYEPDSGGEGALEEELETFAQTAPKEAPPKPSAAVQPAPAEVHSSAELLEAQQGRTADAPLCFSCGTKMRPAGSCYVCEGCGSTSGCS